METALEMAVEGEEAMQGSCMQVTSLASREEGHLLLYSLSEVSNRQTIEESFHF